MGFSLGIGMLFFIHFWSDRKNQGEPFGMILFTLLKFELVFSVISFVFFVFGWFDWWKVLLVLLSAQLIHLMIYLSNMFLFDERSSDRINKSSGGILSSSKQKRAYPEHQDSDSADE
jgi:1,4-dihydroxy-2-naphthoate octaprenyltransferase